MAAVNIATWSKDKKSGGWQLVVTFNRGWEAPPVGAGLGKTVEACILKKGERLRQDSQTTKLRLTSRVFKTGGGMLKAFAEQA